MRGETERLQASRENPRKTMMPLASTMSVSSGSSHRGLVLRLVLVLMTSCLGLVSSVHAVAGEDLAGIAQAIWTEAVAAANNGEWERLRGCVTQVTKNVGSSRLVSLHQRRQTPFMSTSYVSRLHAPLCLQTALRITDPPPKPRFSTHGLASHSCVS